MSKLLPVHEVIASALPLLSEDLKGLQLLREGVTNTELKLAGRQGPGLCAELEAAHFSNY